MIRQVAASAAFPFGHTVGMAILGPEPRTRA